VSANNGHPTERTRVGFSMSSLARSRHRARRRHERNTGPCREWRRCKECGRRRERREHAVNVPAPHGVGKPVILPAVIIAFLFALPWIVLPLIVIWRLRGTPLLEDVSAQAPPDAPAVSVVLPARNEAAHIVACIESLRATSWPNWELIVINDGSTDDTGALARGASADDPRIQVIDAPPLAAGWFGKQWACHTGMQIARGDVLRVHESGALIIDLATTKGEG